ncbi:hypothetical protein ES703_104807 [subsurface metagenome]
MGCAQGYVVIRSAEAWVLPVGKPSLRGPVAGQGGELLFHKCSVFWFIQAVEQKLVEHKAQEFAGSLLQAVVGKAIQELDGPGKGGGQGGIQAQLQALIRGTQEIFRDHKALLYRILSLSDDCKGLLHKALLNF